MIVNNVSVAASQARKFQTNTGTSMGCVQRIDRHFTPSFLLWMLSISFSCLVALAKISRIVLSNHFDLSLLSVMLWVSPVCPLLN